MRAIIMAGGDDAKWNCHLGVRRHFAPIDGEPLLHRTVQQLACRGASIYIVAPDLPEYRIPWTVRVDPETTAWGEEALNAQSLWADNDRTVQVYGDVIFTNGAIDTIANFDRREWQLFGRFGASVTKPYGEIFALSFWPEHREMWAAALREAFTLRARGVIPRAGSWEAFRILGGASGSAVSVHARFPDLMTEIDDGTDDFDTPAEYQALAC